MELTVAEALIDTVDDLRRRSVLRGTEYDAVQAAGLMRRLLLDQHRLLDLANAQLGPLRRKVVFRWYQAWGHEQDDYLIANYSIDPQNFSAIPLLGAVSADGTIRPLDESDTTPPREGKLDAFLRTPVVMTAGAEQVVTSKELIDHYANRLGGVHLDRNRESENPLLNRALERMPNEMRAVVSALGRITVTALDPLAGALFFIVRQIPK